MPLGHDLFGGLVLSGSGLLLVELADGEGGEGGDGGGLGGGGL